MKPEEGNWDAILFVCLGNICRSPMAEHLCRQLLGRSPGRRLPVASCGLNPVLDRATDMALRVMRESGIDMSGHRSRPLSADLLRGSPLVLTMERRHKDHPLLRGRPHVYTLHEFAGSDSRQEVADPYGGTHEVYLACAEQIASLLPGVVARLAT